MLATRSFVKYYWAAWFAALAVYLLLAFFYSPRTALAYFALVAGVGSVYVFHFELGRLMASLKRIARRNMRNYKVSRSLSHSPSFIRASCGSCGSRARRHLSHMRARSWSIAPHGYFRLCLWRSFSC